MSSLLHLQKNAGHREGENPNDLRTQPSSLEDLGVPEIFLTNLTLKHGYFLNMFTIKDLAERLRISPNILMHISNILLQAKCLEIKGPEQQNGKANIMGLMDRYAMTEEGKRQASNFLEYDSYVGPVPVTLEDYWAQVAKQSCGQLPVNPDRIQSSFQGLIVKPELVRQLGPALASGKAIFLYGPSGNGKTTLALRLGQVWDDAILIPYALYVEGQVIRIYDDITNQPIVQATVKKRSADRRWVLCRRPVVVVGGELTMDMLSLTYNESLKYYEAPVQMKANNGIFILDDFGRQQVKPLQLLNRWVFPMENRQDFLYLHTGQKFAVPFDQLLIFATNADPVTIMDPPFARRIRYKIKVDHVDRDQFAAIFRLVCEHHQVAFEQAMVDYLIAHYYQDNSRPMDACHPRDLVEQVMDFCRFRGVSPHLSQENLDHACRTYFLN